MPERRTYSAQADAESVGILRALLAEREGEVEDYRLQAESLGRLVEKWKRMYERRGDALEGQMDDFNAAQAEAERLCAENERLRTALHMITMRGTSPYEAEQMRRIASDAVALSREKS